MNLISCENCGTVLDKDVLCAKREQYRNELDEPEYGTDEWNTWRNKYDNAPTPCPLCGQDLGDI